jgi:hypothetical protein
MKNKEELLERLSTIEREVDAIRKELQKPDAYKRWRAEMGGKYYLITDQGCASGSNDLRTDIDNFRYISGNYFKTREEAEKYRDRLVLLQELKDFAEGYEFQDGQKNYYIYYDYKDNKFIVGLYSMVQGISNVYFKTYEKADEAIKHFGDRLKLLL